MTANQFLEQMTTLDNEIQLADRLLLRATVHAHPKIAASIAARRTTMRQAWEAAWRTRLADGRPQ